MPEIEKALPMEWAARSCQPLKQLTWMQSAVVSLYARHRHPVEVVAGQSQLGQPLEDRIIGVYFRFRECLMPSLPETRASVLLCVLVLAFVLLWDWILTWWRAHESSARPQSNEVTWELLPRGQRKDRLRSCGRQNEVR